MHFSRNDVILLPIPFTDRSSQKVRPAIIIGAGTFEGDVFVVPVTSRLFQTDLVFEDWGKAGLNVPSGIKGQIATIDAALIRQVVGRLSPSDSERLDQKLREWLSL